MKGEVMRKRTLRSMVLTASVFAVFLQSEAVGQPAKVDPNAPAPRLPNGKPDFSGVWARPGVQDLTRTVKNGNGTSNIGEPNPLPFTPWGQAQWDNYNPNKNGDYAGSCMPFGWIRSFTPHPMQIVHNNQTIAFLFEQSTMFQAVNTENLPHRKDWPATWFGDSRGRWDGDTLVIEAINFNGYAKLGTIGHPMSDKAKLTMSFRRPAMGRIEFKWVLDDPKTYTRAISNERVFVLTPNVEIMEYSCMEGNLSSLIDGGVTPWLGPKDSDINLVYDETRQWSAYDMAKAEKLSGVIQQADYFGTPPTLQIEVDGKPVTVILAPAPRMEFRDLNDDMLTPGVSVSVVAYRHKSRRDELRAESITVGKRSFELR
jgi:hypothetical protein